MMSESLLLRINFAQTKQNFKKKKNQKGRILLVQPQKKRKKININLKPAHSKGFTSFKKSKEEFGTKKFLPADPEKAKNKDDIVRQKIEEMKKRPTFKEAQINSFKWAEEVNRNRAQSVSYGSSRKKQQVGNDQMINSLERSCGWQFVNGQNNQTFEQIQNISTPLPATSESKRYKKIQSTLSSYIADGNIEQQTTRPNTGNASRSIKLNLSQLGSTVRSSSLGGGGGFSSRYRDWNCLTKTIPMVDFNNELQDQNKKVQGSEINLYDPTVKIKDFVQVNRMVTQSPLSSPRITEQEQLIKDRGNTQNSRYTDDIYNQYTEDIQNFKNHLIEKLKSNGEKSNDRGMYQIGENMIKPYIQQQQSSRNSINLQRISISFAVQQQYKERMDYSEEVANINSSYNISYTNNPFRNSQFDTSKYVKTTTSPSNRISNKFVIKKRSTSTMRGTQN